MITPERLKEIQALSDNAPELPLFYDKASGSRFMGQDAEEFYNIAREMVPDLIAEVERLQAKLERCQMFAQTWKDLVSTYKEENKRLEELDSADALLAELGKVGGE